MKSVLLLLIYLTAVPLSYGQLSIKPSATNDNYLYVNGTLLFVKQDVNLKKNAEASPTEASIYLRKEAQLIQGGGRNILNSGNGLLSIFQEGTSNTFDYNYWSSPVSDGNLGNGNFGIKMIYSPMNQTKSQNAQYTSSLDGLSSPLTISSRWIFTYSGNSYSDWHPVFNSTTIPAGYGFTMKGVAGLDFTLVDGIPNNAGSSQRYDFRGLPNNGPISIPLTPDEFALVGNPFPSALDLSLFLLENSGTGLLTSSCNEPIERKPVSTGIAYFWDSIEEGTSHYLQDYIGGYGAFSPVDPCTSGIYERPVFRSYKTAEEPGSVGKHYDRRFLPVAQGFMVKGAEKGDLYFDNHHRTFRKEGDLSQFKQFKNANTNTDLKKIPMVRVQAVINKKYDRHITLAFWPNATSSLDMGMDAEAYNTGPTDFGIFHDQKCYVIDVRPFSKTNSYPIYLKVQDPEASLEINVIEIENINIENVYLFDSYYNIYFPLLKNSFRMKLEKGIYHNRFEIVFKDLEKNPRIEDDGHREVIIYQNSNFDQLEIINSGRSPIKHVTVFDLLGKEIFQTRDIRNEKIIISTSSFANSVYIVRVMTKDQKVVTKKINLNKHR